MKILKNLPSYAGPAVHGHVVEAKIEAGDEGDIATGLEMVHVKHRRLSISVAACPGKSISGSVSATLVEAYSQEGPEPKYEAMALTLKAGTPLGDHESADDDSRGGMRGRLFIPKGGNTLKPGEVVIVTLVLNYF